MTHITLRALRTGAPVNTKLNDEFLENESRKSQSGIPKVYNSNFSALILLI